MTDMQVSRRRGATWIAVSIALLLPGIALTAAAPLDAASPGVRLGPLETMCVALPDAVPGDVAIVNLTVVGAGDRGFVTAHNKNSNPAAVSSVNFGAGDVIPNLTATVVTDDGDICVTPSASTSAHVVLDLVGYLDGDTFQPAAGDAERVLDTRRPTSPTAGAPVAPESTVCADRPIGAAGDVAVINATVTQPTNYGFATVHAGGLADPRATSTHNFVPGQTIANLTFTALSADGRVCATMSKRSDAHVIFDLVGVLDPTAFSAAGAGALRLVDTRSESSPTDGERLSPSETLCVDVPDADGGDVAIANVTIAAPTGAGYATVHPEGADPTRTSTHNFAAAQTIANLTATPLPDNRRLCVTPSQWSSVHVVVDLVGVVDVDVVRTDAGGAIRLLDTRRRDVLPGRYGESVLGYGSSCDDLLTRFRDQRLEWLDEIEEFFGDGPPPLPLPATNGNEAIGAPDFSTTNVQTTGVDEGDLVETDGTFLYTTVEDELRVIDISSATVVARVRLDGDSAEMILADNRLMVTTTGFSDESFGQTNVVVIDVTDPTLPAVVDRYGLDGTRQAMRSVGSTVHIVLASDRSPDGTEYFWSNDLTFDERRTRVEESSIGDWLPHVREIESGGEYGDSHVAIECDQIGQPHVDSGTELTWIASDDLRAGTGPDDTSGVMADAAQTTVMASRTNLYVATTTFPWWGPGAWRNGETLTSIHLFEMLATPGTRYGASTDVPGRLVNQFAMGEHNGVLRVAVTEGWWNEAASAVFALRRRGPTFERLSVVNELGLTERIYAVRHVGDLSYVVTFRETDPLYVLDFSDPERPEVAGELKIPGFSTYLHPVGPDVILGVGQDADENGNVLGAQLSVFDVADPHAPRRVATLALDSVETLDDHRAFLFWPPTGTIALPASDASGKTSIAVARLDGTRLVSVGNFASADYSCAPQRTVLVGDELIAIGRYTTVFADRSTLRERATVGDCIPPWVIESVS